MEEFLARYPLPRIDNEPVNLLYGTAGFRGKAEFLDHVVARMSLVSALRSLTSGKRFVGLCITASHNPVADNGIKFIEADGTLPSAEFEKQVTEFINSEKPEEAFHALCVKAQQQYNVTVDSLSFNTSYVLLGSDTRPSSSRLRQIIHEGLRIVKASFYDFGYITTPQLYFFVHYYNTYPSSNVVLSNFSHQDSFSIEHYVKWFSSRFLSFVKVWWKVEDVESCPQHSALPDDQLIIDGANGPGGHQFKPFVQLLSFLNVRSMLLNTGDEPDSVINDNCGADFVKKRERCPRNFEALIQKKETVKCCSFDGDADRIIYFIKYTDSSKSIVVLDGDRILSLFTKLCFVLIMEMLKSTNKKCPRKPLRIGIIQTGYANGASTEFLKSLIAQVLNCETNAQQLISCQLLRTSTGVKHLAHRAKDFHIALYFESNGHGTIFTDFNAVEQWSNETDLKSDRNFQVFLCFIRLFEYAEGDAMVNVLGVELALRYLGMSLHDWVNLYQELCTVQASSELPRRFLNTLVTDTHDETILLEPKSLAEALSNIIKNTPSRSRAFLRPSGTEDVCRIYAEASDAETAQLLVETYENELRKCFSSFLLH